MKIRHIGKRTHTYINIHDLSKKGVIFRVGKYTEEHTHTIHKNKYFEGTQIYEL